MGYRKCKQCSEDFFQDDSGPNAHYHGPRLICTNCEDFNRLPVGATYQKRDGSYHTKTDDYKTPMDSKTMMAAKELLERAGFVLISPEELDASRCKAKEYLFK